MFITGVNGTGNKLFTGVNDTRDKFSLIPGVVDTSGCAAEAVFCYTAENSHHPLEA
jgi:hypothetical protein